MTQPSLFDAPLARRLDHDSSYAAADRIVRSGTKKAHEELILFALQYGPMNAHELGEATGLDNVRVCRRMASLVRRGLVVRIAQPGAVLRWRLAR